MPPEVLSRVLGDRRAERARVFLRERGVVGVEGVGPSRRDASCSRRRRSSGAPEASWSSTSATNQTGAPVARRKRGDARAKGRRPAEKVDGDGGARRPLVGQQADDAAARERAPQRRRGAVVGHQRHARGARAAAAQPAIDGGVVQRPVHEEPVLPRGGRKVRRDGARQQLPQADVRAAQDEAAALGVGRQRAEAGRVERSGSEGGCNARMRCWPRCS